MEHLHEADSPVTLVDSSGLVELSGAQRQQLCTSEMWRHRYST